MAVPMLEGLGGSLASDNADESNRSTGRYTAPRFGPMTGGMGVPDVLISRTARRALLGGLALVVAAAAVLAWPASARAGLTTFQFPLGQQDFAGDNSQVLDSQIRAAGAGEAYPFNGTVFGDDRAAKLGSLEYTHTFDAATILRQSDGAMRSATLTLGVIDIDSPPGYQPTLGLWFNGVRQPVDALFTGISAPGIPSSAEVVTVPVPLNLLENGSLNIRLAALRHAPGFRGNSIAVDFSTLTIEANQPNTPADYGTRGSGGVPWGSGGGGPDKPPTAVPLLPSDVAATAAATTLALGGLLVRAGRRRRRRAA